jgi:hypothetical protein
VLDSMLTGELMLSDAHIDGVLSLNGTVITGETTADRLVIGSSLFMRNTTFGDEVTLRNADIHGDLDMAGATLVTDKPFDASQLTVGRSLFMLNAEFAGPVTLRGADVHGQLGLDGAKFAANKLLNASELLVGSSLFMRNATFGGAVSLLRAQVHGQIVMDGARFAAGQQLDADGLQAGSTLFMNHVEFGGRVILRRANVHGDVDTDGTRFAPGQPLIADGIQVGGDMFLTNAEFGGGVTLRGAHVHDNLALDAAKFAPGQPFDGNQLHVDNSVFMRNVTADGDIDLVAATIGRNLDLRGSTLRRLDLSGATVNDDMRLASQGVRVTWQPSDESATPLVLRNTRIGNLQDDEHAWPSEFDLAGFTYTHLGGYGGEGSQEMRGRVLEWWHDWLAHDPIYSPQPYTQLASVLAAAGNRDAAESIRFFGRDRERIEALRGCVWLQRLGLVAAPPAPRPCDWGSGVGLGILQVFVGYGIGGYTFRALYWAIGLALFGTVILRVAPGVRLPLRLDPRSGRWQRPKSTLWCFGASLSHLLPIVSLSPEFSDFFNDPERHRLYAWQQVAFAILALCGWALGLFVVAAFSGLTQT